MRLEIEELLRSRAITPLRFLMTRDEVIVAIGEPQGRYEHGTVLIDKYGPFQVHFENNSLTSVVWLLSHSGEAGSVTTRSFPTSSTTIYEFLEYCDGHHIPWSICQRRTFDRQLAIQTCQGVVAVFDLDFRELQKIVVTARNGA